jgi:tRNA(fMet)-specific endonuclease VapC
MKILLLDTDVVSFILKGDSRAMSYAPRLQGCKLSLSFMSVAELSQWAAVRKWGTRRSAKLQKALEQYVILPVDLESCRLWGEIRAKRRAIGRPISPQDAWIAASARRFKLPLVTHNPADFELIDGLEIVTAEV